MRAPSLHHCTSEPLRFFGRQAELRLLDQALAGGAPSVIALVGPGGQGKTAIVQHWLQQHLDKSQCAGIFFWSFYRGKDSDLCLRELFAYAEGMTEPPQISASYCVDRMLPRLQTERWALILDGVEVVQHEAGAWFGRFVHPELGRLLEELASAPLPGVTLLTSRFPVPTLQTRRHARVLSLATLDIDSALGLLETMGVRGSRSELEAAAQTAGLHAKAVELLGAWLTRFHQARAAAHRLLPGSEVAGDASAEEAHVARVLAGFQRCLPPECRDILALTVAFRQPPTEPRVLEYLASDPVRRLLHDDHGRSYEPFQQRPPGWLAAQLDELVALRLLERVRDPRPGRDVLDTHPLVRRGFEDALRGDAATARAGFLRGRPDRRPPATLDEAREEVELFHAYCDAGLWNEADSTFVALDNPKHRFVAPAFERDLLLRFFRDGDWRQPPHWPGFGRWRSLAICLEMLGQFDDALQVYRSEDAALQGDALIARGTLGPLLTTREAAHPWQTLWQAYRAHALTLAGREPEALAVAQTTLPIDVYEWVHVFEALLRLGRLEVLDLPSLLYTPPLTQEYPWSQWARRRMRADYLRVRGDNSADLDGEYARLHEAYERAGLPLERVLTGLAYGRWLLTQGRRAEAAALQRRVLDLTQRHRMLIYEIDAWELAQALEPDAPRQQMIDRLRREREFFGPTRP